MAVKRNGLGKGLDSLIPNKSDKLTKPETKKNNSEVKVSPAKKVKEDPKASEILLKINQVEPNRDQPRKEFDEDALLELADSIKQFGVLQPLLVQKKKDYYEIIAGERRWRAAKLAGLKEVPVLIKSYTDQEIVEISLIENIQREDLNSIEEAIAYKKLISDFDLTQEQLSKRIGKSRVAITNTMRLLNLSEDVQQYIIEGVISEGHGRALLAITDSKLQCELAQNVIDDKLSVRELEFLIRKLKTKSEPSKSKAKKETNPYYKEVIEKLENYFGTKVNVTNKNNKGKIEIEYYSEEDLQRILEIINL